MDMAGYSGTPLAKKLGIKPGHQVALWNAPAEFESTLDDLPTDAVVTHDPRSQPAFDVLVCFVPHLKALRSLFPACAKKMQPAAGFWVAWPKKSSAVATDLTEDVIRVLGLDAGLVDNKVFAIDETGSGLRFVIRLADR